MPIPAELRTPRLLLRRWRADDAVQLEPILRRDTAHLGPWIPATVASPASVPELVDRLTRFAGDFDADRVWRFALIDSAGNLLGGVDLFPRNASGRVALAEADRAEVGYWLRSDRTGEGFVTEGVKAVIDAAVGMCRFAHLEIRCDVRNTRSSAVAARLGFGAPATVAPGELAVWTLPLAVASRCRVVASGEAYVGRQNLTYLAGLTGDTAGARGICMMVATLPPGARAKAHLHRGIETAVHIIEGEASTYFGDHLQDVAVARAGEYVYIPADVPHLVINQSGAVCRAVVAHTAASDQEGIVLLPELDALI